MIRRVPRGTCPDIPGTENYAYFCVDDCVYFSATQQGEAMSIHIAAPTREAKRNIRNALNRFCEWLFEHYQWCRMIIGIVGPQSVVNLLLKCGFENTGEVGPASIMVRKRP